MENIRSDIRNNGTWALSGNPFVDTGLAVIASLASLEDVTQLTLEHVHDVHGDGRQLASWNGALSSFVMIFTNNSLLTNPSVKDKKKREGTYVAVINALLEHVGKDDLPFRCEACGSPGSVNFEALCRQALPEKAPDSTDSARKPNPLLPRKLRGKEHLETEPTRFIGRDWFPLAGSLGSDAQALPAASRAAHICARCLFAVHYLPLAVMLLDGSLAIFQSTSVQFWYEMVGNITRDMHTRVGAGIYETIGRRETASAVVRRLMDVFRELREAKRLLELPSATTLQVWRFSNIGASPKCEIQEIPNSALLFLWSAQQNGLRDEIVKLVQDEGRREHSFLRCVEEGVDYARLYPRRTNPGASPKLFGLYQNLVCKRSLSALTLANLLATTFAQESTARDLKRACREEAFLESTVRHTFRRKMADMAEEGQLTLDNYLELFEPDDGPGVRVRFAGWNLIHYFLHHPGSALPADSGFANRSNAYRKQTVACYYASAIFDAYIADRGKQRFQSEVLDRLRRGAISTRWLKGQFVRLAETAEGFNYSTWQSLCGDPSTPAEPLFQMRLLWLEWMAGQPRSAATAAEQTAESGLPSALENRAKAEVANYIEKRGIDRFHRNVLLALRRGRIDLGWLKVWLVREANGQQPQASLSEDDWDSMMYDDHGKFMPSERLFQIHLLLAGLYRQHNLRGGMAE